MANDIHRQTLLKKNNIAQIMLGVWRHRPISRSELARITGLSMRCACGLVDELVQEGALIETGSVSAPRGRPRVMVDINPDGDPVAGIWMTPTFAEIVVANPAGEFLARRTVQHDCRTGTPEGLLVDLSEGVRRCADAAGKDVRRLQGIGLALADMVGSMLGTIESRYDMPGWDGLSVSDLLSEGLGVPAYLDNDVRAAATAAEWFGNGNTGGALYISVGNGMGFAYVQPQGIFRGAHGMAGQLEHLVIDRDGPVCECGNRGCLLTVATDSVFLKKLWPELPDDLRNVPMSRRSELMQDGYDLAAGGDVKAREALTSVLSALAVGLANVVNLFDPQVVYLFGALIDPAPDVILDIIRKEALPRVRPQVRGVEIRPIHGSWVDFFLRGSIGLVIGEQIRLLHQANASTRTINGLDGPTKTDRLTAKRMTQQPSNMLTGH